MINTIQTAEPLSYALKKLCLVMAPASQVIFSKGHQILKSIRRQVKQKNPVFVSFISITAIKAKLY